MKQLLLARREDLAVSLSEAGYACNLKNTSTQNIEGDNKSEQGQQWVV
jgi:hypothetical protein